MGDALMQEKKRTDEEIVKAYAYCRTVVDCDNCPYDAWGCGIGVKDIIDIINRQKAEIERLNGCILKYAETLGNEQRKSAELQTQVDELKETLRLRNIQLEDLRKYDKEIVKDTAKKILKWLKSEVIMTEIPHGSEPCEEDVEAVMWWQIEEHFKKKYGVEVE